MDIPQIIFELKKILPEENFHIEPSTSKNELIKLEIKYGISTFEFVNMKKDISHISEDERNYWLERLETYFTFGGIVEGINN